MVFPGGKLKTTIKVFLQTDLENYSFWSEFETLQPFFMLKQQH